MSNNNNELTPDRLRWRCNLDKFNFKTTEEIQPTERIIGQERALRAILLGLEVPSIGYNIFVTGLSGTGRTTTIKSLLEGIDSGDHAPDDICYVNNFHNPDMPRVIKLPAGRGRAFQRNMDDLVALLKKNIPAILESEEFQKRSRQAIEKIEDRGKEILREFERKVERENFALIQVQLGSFVKPDIAPLINRQPVSIDQLEAMVEKGEFLGEDFLRLREKYEQLSSELESIAKQVKQMRKEIAERLEQVQRDMVAPWVRELINDIKSTHKSESVNSYLDQVEQSILENLDRFREREAVAASPAAAPADEFLEYKVNVVVDNSYTKGAPVIIENFPSYKNLFGTIEKVLDRSGQWRTDFTKIKAGSFVRANGGYLVLNALDALVEPGVWPALKRTLKTRKVEIQAYDPFYMFTTSALKPEAIDTDVKVVMIGDAQLYNILYAYDEDFKKIFKVNADFDSEMDNDEQSLGDYIAVMSKIIREEGLLHFDRSGVAAVIEFGVRQAGRQNKITARFTDVADLLREASYWAQKDGSGVVSEKHVDQAIEEKVFRSRLIEDKIQEMIRDGIIMIDTEGSKVGQVNGLSIYDLGYYSFGRPSRITAQIAMGKAGIINIEREAQLSGRIHDKGVLILSGYLRGKYSQDKPLTVSASICFEQSYSGIEGDSASSAELYALLSALSGLPIRQDLAVTGSVNQKGEIQPIGGVNQKIEGFFDVCKIKGLTGTQGVLIPHQNAQNLMLRKDVVRAVSEGKFHIYTVRTIDEGIEILTGVRAGERQEDGSYPEGTVNFLVDMRLRQLAEGIRQFEAPSRNG